MYFSNFDESYCLLEDTVGFLQPMQYPTFRRPFIFVSSFVFFNYYVSDCIYSSIKSQVFLFSILFRGVYYRHVLIVHSLHLMICLVSIWFVLVNNLSVLLRISSSVDIQYAFLKKSISATAIQITSFFIIFSINQFLTKILEKKLEDDSSCKCTILSSRANNLKLLPDSCRILLLPSICIQACPFCKGCHWQW